VQVSGLSVRGSRLNGSTADPRGAPVMSEWWQNTESRRLRLGRWEFYRDRRDWWIGVFLSERATYFGFLTLIAKRGGADRARGSTGQRLTRIERASRRRSREPDSRDRLKGR
jgi:hypothetical protein